MMILRHRPFGNTIAFSLVLDAVLLPLITIATFVLVDLGIEFEPPEIIGPIAGFSILAAFSLLVIARIFSALAPTNKGAATKSNHRRSLFTLVAVATVSSQ